VSTKRLAGTLGIAALLGTITAWMIPNALAYPVGAGLAIWVAWHRHRRDVEDV
jgi:hypothetical protein